MSIDNNGNYTIDELPYDEETDDQSKETETYTPTEKNNDNKKLGTTTNEYGVLRSTRGKSQSTSYVPIMGSERKYEETAD